MACCACRSTWRSSIAATSCPAAEPVVAYERGAFARVDGRRGWGQLAARLAAETAIRLAQSHGVGAVTVDRCTHVGRLGEYVEEIAAAGLVGHALGNADPAVAPPGTAVRAMGTNPVAWAIPRAGGDPVLVDFATAEMAEGKLRVAVAREELLPLAAIVDVHGRPSQTPSDFYDGGALVPFGGHKGYGLSVAAELIARGLSRRRARGRPRHPLRPPDPGPRPGRRRTARDVPVHRRHAGATTSASAPPPPVPRSPCPAIPRPAPARAAGATGSRCRAPPGTPWSRCASASIAAPRRPPWRRRRRDFSGKTVVITGAAGGIGSAVARGFAARGASLALLDIADEPRTALAEELRSTGDDACSSAAATPASRPTSWPRSTRSRPSSAARTCWSTTRPAGAHTRPEELTTRGVERRPRRLADRLLPAGPRVRPAHAGGRRRRDRQHRLDRRRERHRPRATSSTTSARPASSR